MGDARQVDAHSPRMWLVQKGDKLIAYCGRGIDIDPALQRRQSALFAGNDVDFRLIDSVGVATQDEGGSSLRNVPNFHDIAKINSKLLTAFVRPLADSRNPRQVKDLRRRCSDDANDLDTIRAGAPEYGQMRSAAFGS